MDNPLHANDLTRHRAQIQTMFEMVAPRYDLMNDLMSQGIHRVWKRRLVDRAGRSTGLAVDLAGGTGDIASRLVERGWRVQVIDPSEAMMHVGRQRVPGVEDWIAAVGEGLPLADHSVDLVTISFGLRNTSAPNAVLAEAFRVLKPGGRFLCLEFSTPSPWLKPWYDAYSRYIIPTLGALIAGKRDAYTYLVESIRAFPDQDTLKTHILNVGFESVTYKNLSYGIAAIHEGRKPR